MSKLFNITFEVIETSSDRFMGVPLYHKGEIIHGVIDQESELVYIKRSWGNQLLRIRNTSQFRILSITDYEEGRSIEDLSTYIKEISIRQWLHTNNILDIYSLVYVSLSSSSIYQNNVDGNGGAEYLFNDRKYFAIVHQDNRNEYIAQIRKGSIFYLPHDVMNFTTESIRIDELSYEMMKEIRFLVENNYKIGGIYSGY